MGAKQVRQLMSFFDGVVEDAATLAGSYDQDGIEDLADRLHDMGGLTIDEMRARMIGVTMPGDFRHMRLYNHTLDRAWGGMTNRLQEVLTIDKMLIILCGSSRITYATKSGRGLWYETTALPVRNPAVLELGLRFRELN